MRTAVKSYTILNPEGDLVNIVNLKAFCRENHLHYPKMNQAANGISQYKGWKAPSFVHKPLKRFLPNYIKDQVFGRLTVISSLPKEKGKGTKWKCLCSCGNTVELYAKSLSSDRTQSCGCLIKEKRVTSNTKHNYCGGGSKKPEYVAWTGAINRCENKKDIAYPDYGGRGIKMAPRWRESFSNFIADMGDKPEPKRSYSLDRINVNGDYEPENCRWATRLVQNNNKRTDAITVLVKRFQTIFGISLEEFLSLIPER